MPRHGVFVIGLHMLAGISLLAQAPQPPVQTGQPPVTFKVEVNYVEIDATVVDAQGQFVRDLTKDDFQVSEEGKPQAITAFTRVDVPVKRNDPPLFRQLPIEPDVQTNREEFNGRVFVLMLDDLQTDFRRSARVKAAARQFIERYIGANDLAAVVYTGSGADKGQEFTSSRPRLIAAVDKFMGTKLPSATLTTLDDYYMQRASGRGFTARDTSEMERGFKARNTLTSLRNVADFLAGVRGRRKAVVWFGEGIDYDLENPFARDTTVLRSEMQDAIAAANRASVSFYGVDPRGLGAGLDEAIDIRALPDDPGMNLGMTSIQNEVRRAQDTLRTVSAETGGFAIVNQNDLNAAFERVVQDNSSYYVLGYYASNDKRDGRFRNVAVRVSRPGLQVRARKGYFAPKGRPASAAPSTAEARMSPEVRAALASPIPSTGLGLTVFTAPFIGSPPKASVAVVLEIDPRHLQFVETGGTFNEDLEVHILAIDEKGKLQDGGRDTVPLRLSARSHDVVTRGGFRLTRRLNVPPGRYQIRIAVREANGGAFGTLVQNLDVPDFSKGPLQLSGIVLASASESRIPTANPDAGFKDVLPSPPTAVREFPPSDALALFAEVYDNQTGPRHRVAITTTIRADGGKVVFTAGDERGSEELQGQKGGFGYTQQIPLAGLAPGRYVLRVEAKTTLVATGGTVARELEFRVR